MNPLSVRTTLCLTATLLGVTSQNVSAASVDAAPGFLFSTLPFSDTGTTIGAVSNINSLPSGISRYTEVAGPDVFYTFRIGTAGTLTFTVSPTGFDPAIYLLTGGTEGANAIFGRDDTQTNVTETLTTGVLQPGVYYFVVDSFYSSGADSAGAYSLSVTGTATIIPEPGSAALGLTALAGVAWRRRRRGAR